MNTDTRITREMVIADNLVDRYLLGKMNESEAMAFEDFYASDPETLSDLETSAMLIDSMQQSGRSGELSTADSTRSNVVPLHTRIKRFMAKPAYGIAASFAAAACAALLVASNVMDTTGTEGAQLMAANVTLIELSPTRGADVGPEVAMREGPVAVVLLDLGFADAPSYTATLHTAGGDFVKELSALTPDEIGMLSVVVPAELMPAGSYRFTVRSEGDRGDTLQFPFDIAAPRAGVRKSVARVRKSRAPSDDPAAAARLHCNAGARRAGMQQRSAARACTFSSRF